MMRPMKLAGSQLMFGQGTLEYITAIETKRASIVIGGNSMRKNGILNKVIDRLERNGAVVDIISGVEPDPSFITVKQGADQMKQFKPDLIVGLGGGSAMDAAKAMWVYYEHPELERLDQILTANPFPKLRAKARLLCIPSTAGTASEVSRSFVITENGQKHGLGNMEMMPDIAICDPEVTLSLPPSITAETGMDALTHALEAYVSKRANYVTDFMCEKAIKDIFKYLPIAVERGDDIKAREKMLNASMVAGMAFTNVSLGIVHAIAHAVGGRFHVAHGLADAVALPYVIEYNRRNQEARDKYDQIAQELGEADLVSAIQRLNKKVKIPARLQDIIPQDQEYMNCVDQMAAAALVDGVTKTNPIIPDLAEMKNLFQVVYWGKTDNLSKLDNRIGGEVKLNHNQNGGNE